MMQGGASAGGVGGAGHEGRRLRGAAQAHLGGRGRASLDLDWLELRTGQAGERWTDDTEGLGQLEEGS
jgi:hypothetical protein